jgi:hypothetical protein
MVNVAVHIEGAQDVVTRGFNTLLGSLGEKTLLTAKAWWAQLARCLGHGRSSPVLLLIQGPLSTIQRVQRQMGKLDVRQQANQLKVVAIETPRMHDNLKDEGRNKKESKKQRMMLPFVFEGSFRLSHRAVGGVVDYHWLVRTNWELSNTDMERVQRNCGVIAEVGDFLSTTVKGKEVEAPAPRSEKK